jgi:hypothetical protein
LINQNILSDYLVKSVRFRPDLEIMSSPLFYKNESSFWKYVNENRLYGFDFNEINNYLLKCDESLSEPINYLGQNLFNKKGKEICDLPPHPRDFGHQLINADTKVTNENPQIFIQKDDKDEEKSTKSILSSIISKFELTDDFLSIEDDVDIGFDAPLGLLDDDEDIFIYKKSDRYLTKDQLSILNMNFTIEDIFVEKPFDRRNKPNRITFSRQNYLINKILHLPDVNLLCKLNKYTNIYSSIEPD